MIDESVFVSHICHIPFFRAALNLSVYSASKNLAYSTDEYTYKG